MDGEDFREEMGEDERGWYWVWRRALICSMGVEIRETVRPERRPDRAWPIVGRGFGGVVVVEEEGVVKTFSCRRRR